MTDERKQILQNHKRHKREKKKKRLFPVIVQKINKAPGEAVLEITGR